MAHKQMSSRVVSALRHKSGPERAKKRAESKALIEKYTAKGHTGKYRVTSTNTSYTAMEKRYLRGDSLGQNK